MCSIFHYILYSCTCSFPDWLVSFIICFSSFISYSLVIHLRTLCVYKHVKLCISWLKYTWKRLKPYGVSELEKGYPSCVYKHVKLWVSWLKYTWKRLKPYGVSELEKGYPSCLFLNLRQYLRLLTISCWLENIFATIIIRRTCQLNLYASYSPW